MREVLLVRFGEVHLKGLNRPYFMRALVEHVKQAVRPYNGCVWLSEGRIYVRDMTDMQACVQRVTRVFGIHSVSPAIEMEKDDFSALCRQAVELMRPFQGTFKVKARRADKRFTPDSPAICEEVGGCILDALPGLTVDVHHPEHTLQIEIREMAYLYVTEVMAVGGMPMGTNGQACLLLSGGIDSPVAGYMTAKRGVSLCCVYYHSFPYTSERARDKVVELARLLSEYCGTIKLFVVPFTEIQMKIHSDCPDHYTT
ncbi:MAG: THUMP domain-containing protein, partial [Clostridia bacterium]